SLYGERGGEIVRDGAVVALRRLGDTEDARQKERPEGPRRRGRRARGSTQSRLGQSVQLLRERGFLARGGVPGHGPAASRLIERADRRMNRGLGFGRLRVDRRAGGLHGGADLASRGAIALAPLLALLHPLDRGTRVGHDDLPPRNWRWDDT